MIDIIHSNIYSKITLNEIASQLKRDYTYLSQIFKSEVGVTVSEYISKIKINEAKFLLESTNKTITDIGYMLCYSDTASFRRLGHGWRKARQRM